MNIEGVIRVKVNQQNPRRGELGLAKKTKVKVNQQTRKLRIDFSAD